MPDILAAVWGAQHAAYADTTLNHKIAELARVADRVNGWMRMIQLERALVNPVFLLAVPEYYFVHDTDFAPLSAAEHRRVTAAVRTISAALPRMVLVPGSINYAIPMQEVARRWEAEGRNKRERSNLVRSNTPVFYGGVCVLDYDKRANDAVYDETQAQHDAWFQPGYGPGTFSCATLRMGLDVCQDYRESRLAKDVPNRDLDVQIIVSGTMTNMFDPKHIAARDGGFIIHADNDDRAEHLAQKNGAFLVARGRGTTGMRGRDLDLAMETYRQSPSLAGVTHDEREATLAFKRDRMMDEAGPKEHWNTSRLNPEVTLNPWLKIYHCPMG